MHKIQKVLVYGATGPQGRAVADRLIDDGFSVRVLVRDPEKATDLAARGAEVVRGDFSDATSLARANEGMQGLFLVAPYLMAQPGVGRAVGEAARNAGVELLVWNTTGFIPDSPSGNSGNDSRLEIRTALAEARVPVISLEPTMYMENFLAPWTAPEVAEAGTFAYPLPPEARVQPICHADVAAFAAQAFARPELAGRHFAISGPETLDGNGIAQRFSEALGRPIGFRSMQPEEFGRILDSIFGAGAGDSATQFYRAAFANPAIISTSVDLRQALTELPITPTPLATWVAGFRGAFSKAA